jgi:hypothetical protein
VTPGAATSTPDGAMEAAISPAVTTQRATYDFTKVGTIMPKPPEMGVRPDDGNGVYWPSKWNKAPSAAYPDRRFAYLSTDHTPLDGGIFMFVAIGDPSVSANVLDYTAAVAAGWLDDIPSKPSANPIWLGGELPGTGRQIETPCVFKVGSTWVMFYQRLTAAGLNGVGNARNQATCRATSTDGVNWTGNNWTIAQIPSSEVIGDGHTGYMTAGPNPFTGLINPATSAPWAYVGYSLAGGQERSTNALWACENPLTDNWTFITALNKWAGRSVVGGAVGNWQNFSPTNIDFNSCRQTRQGVAMICQAAVKGAGATARTGDLFEILVANDGVTMLGVPQLLIGRGGTGTIDNGEVGRGEISIFGDKAVMMYTAANSGNVKVGAAATSPIRNPENTWFNLLSPAIPEVFDTKSINFKSAGSIPAGWTAVTAGTVAPVTTFTSDGLSITVDGTQAVKGEYMLWEDVGFDPQTTAYVDVYLQDWQTTSARADRIPFIGFSATKSLRADMTDAVFLSNGESTGTQLHFQALVASAQPLAAKSSEYYWGVGLAASVNQTAASKKNLGIRYFPQDNRAFILGEGGVEMEEMITGSGNYVGSLDKTKRMYLGFGFRGTNTAVATERVGRITVKVREAVAQPGDATIGDTNQAVSASNASTYTFTGLGLGTPGATRKIAIFVTGRAIAQMSSVAATLTPSGEAAIPLTIRHLHNSSYDAPNSTFAAMFVATAPVGATGDLVVTLGNAAVRCGVRAVAMYDVDSEVPASVQSASAIGNAASLSVVVDKQAGGVIVASAIVSTSTSTRHNGAAQATVLGAATATIGMSVLSGESTWTGIANGTASTQLEATGSNGAAMIVATFARIP